jgi:rubrerythrin
MSKRWECEICGYVHTGSQPPEECPICGAAAADFLRIEEADEH